MGLSASFSIWSSPSLLQNCRICLGRTCHRFLLPLLGPTAPSWPTCSWTSTTWPVPSWQYVLLLPLCIFLDAQHCLRRGTNPEASHYGTTAYVRSSVVSVLLLPGQRVDNARTSCRRCRPP